MALSCTQPPQTDPTPIFEIFRGNHATELLAAAVAPPGRLPPSSPSGRITFDELRSRLELGRSPRQRACHRPAAMGLIDRRTDGRLDLTPVAREHLVPGGAVRRQRLRRPRRQQPRRARHGRAPAHQPPGRRDEDRRRGVHLPRRHRVGDGDRGQPPATSRSPSPAGRRTSRPSSRRSSPLDGATQLLDVGGGTGIYSIALLQKTPEPPRRSSSIARRC